MPSRSDKSTWRIFIFATIVAVLGVLVGLAAGSHYGKSPKFSVREFGFFEVAAFVFLSTIQDLRVGNIKIEGYGIRLSYDRTTVSYWVYIVIVIVIAFAAFCAFQASTVFWL